MSVKLMSVDDLKNDLQTIFLTWPDGVPWEQTDRVNALKGELKRRGEEFTLRPGPAVTPTQAVTLKKMTTTELEAQLRQMSERLDVDPDDQVAQTRFADVRYELRGRRQKEEPARMLELPDEDDVVDAIKKAEDGGGTKKSDPAAPKVMPSASAVTRNLRRPAQVIESQVGRKLMGASVATSESDVDSVRGFTITGDEDDETVTIKFEFELGFVAGATTSVCIAREISIEEAKAIVRILRQAVLDAAA